MLASSNNKSLCSPVKWYRIIAHHDGKDGNDGKARTIPIHAVYPARSSNCQAFSQHHKLSYSKIGGLLYSSVKMLCVLSKLCLPYIQNRRLSNLVSQTAVHFLNTKTDLFKIGGIFILFVKILGVFSTPNLYLQNYEVLVNLFFKLPCIFSTTQISIIIFSKKFLWILTEVPLDREIVKIIRGWKWKA